MDATSLTEGEVQDHVSDVCHGQYSYVAVLGFSDLRISFPSLFFSGRMPMTKVRVYRTWAATSLTAPSNISNASSIISCVMMSGGAKRIVDLPHVMMANPRLKHLFITS